jgi:hypothetical protein
MGLGRKLVPFSLLLVLGGCATLPTGPGVNVLPAPGKSFDTFRTEDASCRQWAEQRLGSPTQESYDQHVATGAVAGTALGAGLGAAMGSASGNAGAGALIGAASGLFLGSVAGADSGQVYGREAQRRYDNAYVQCMYSYGNQVPGRRVAATPPRPVVAAPPPPPPPPPVMARVEEPYYDAEPPPEMAPEPDHFPVPVEVYVDEAPQFIFSPALNMYVAVGVPYDLMYNGSDFYYYNAGRWYRGPFYNGPWAPLRRASYPPVFLRYRIGSIRKYRDVEYRRYERDRGHYNGKLHRPAFRERRKAEHADERRHEVR